MGLRHPEDLAAWSAWQEPGIARRALARVRRGSRGPELPDLVLASTGATPRVLVALDSANPSSRAALMSPARRLPSADVLHLGPRPVLEAAGVLQAPGIVTAAWSAPGSLLRGIERVVSTGVHLPAGAAAYEWAQSEARETAVVQHGLLTPWAAPLPRDAVLLSFTEQDGAFWASGRRDVKVRAVGSQALWAASAGAAEAEGHDRPLVFLGQLHGKELPRREIVGQTLGFLRAHPETVYRPHPSEKDVLSRMIHAQMQRRGTAFQDTSVPLGQSTADVVSVFSTGVLEAAQQGRRAWVHHDDPPAWLREFWDRYGLARWGGEPTPPVRWSEREPAQAVAEYLQSGELR